MVQLATGTNKNIYELVKSCKLEMNGFPTEVDLNIFPLGYYDILIGMDQLQ